MNLPRRSGVLLHISSLPGRYGIGTLGDEAREFVRFLVEGGFSYWQILPAGPVTPEMGYSPYASPSTFAGNKYLIDIEHFFHAEWCTLEHDDPPEEKHFIDYRKVMAQRDSLFERAVTDFFDHAPDEELEAYQNFCENEACWLDDYALFSALAEHHNTYYWPEWDKDAALRDTSALSAWKERLSGTVKREKFLQYIFAMQWTAMKGYCNDCGIQLIGDIPIYVTFESADAWANPEIFQLDEETGRPEAVSGVPPDYFSETGQRWGNPLYKWFHGTEHLHEKTVKWWIDRIRHQHTLVDILRIDHFRGFESYWAIPHDEETAIHGTWVAGPGKDLFDRIKDELGALNLIAEDLGIITPEVEKLRDDLSLPGMKILQFAFDYNNENYYLPHNITETNCILYTGTHDNNTTNGWFYGREVDENKQNYIMEYMGAETKDDFHWKLIKLAYMTIAGLVIVPMQDILGFSEDFRMNTPGTTEGNWGWKLVSGFSSEKLTSKLKHIAWLYRRENPEGKIISEEEEHVSEE